MALLQHLQVLNQRVRSWEKKGEREAGQFNYVTGILFTEGAPEEVCDFVLPKEHPEVKPGLYSCVLTLGVTFEKKLIGRILQLLPYRPMAPKAA